MVILICLRTNYSITYLSLVLTVPTLENIFLTVRYLLLKLMLAALIYLVFRLMAELSLICLLIHF